VNLILLTSDELKAGTEATISDDRARHLLRVLHAAPGQRVRVGIIDGPKGEPRSSALNKTR
jgi:16S rRNA U1498 N3-methylase RsmE